LVGNLLDLSRLRAGALVPNKVQTALDEVIEGVVARLNRRLDGHEIEMNLRDDLPEVPLDIVQLDQALTNLIENAAKFGPSGSLITVGAVAAPDRVRVSVSDRGPGIPPADRTRVFEPFEVGDKSQGGSGLGLAIARAVVVAHGGRIWIADAPAGGTSVVFELPLEDELEPGEEGS
jgi:two-component system sensor histidine kinase KdpD